MIKLNVPDMSCGHCVGSITKAIKELDGAAVLDFDLPARAVKVDTTAAADAVIATLAEAGYPATEAR